MDPKRFEKIIGRNTAWERTAMDSDGDKVNNALDCQPYNPKKQGIIHEIGQRISEHAQARKQESAANKIIRNKARAAGLRAREKAAIKYAEEREERRYKDRTRRDAGGGFFGTIASQIGKATAPPKRERTYRKKSKAKRTERIRARPPMKRSLESYNFTSGHTFI